MENIPIMVHIFNRLRNNLFNYTTCFDPNGSSSGVFSYTSFTIEPTEPYNKQKKNFREGQEEYTTTKDTKPILAHVF
jgi:hypothetical protein